MEPADGKMTVPAMTLPVPSVERRTRFLFLPRPDAMSSARTAGARTPPDATIAAVDAADSVLGRPKSKTPHIAGFLICAKKQYT